jgi:hypothetical protein
MNEYKPLKLDAPTVPAQGTAFATGGKQGKKKGADKTPDHEDYIKASERNKLSPEARTKIIEARKKKSKALDDDDKSVASVKSLTKTVKSLEKSNRKLKKSVSVPCRSVRKKMTPTHLCPLKVQAISRGEWKCCKNPTQRLSLPSSQKGARILTSGMSSYWTTSQHLTFVATTGLRPRSSEQPTPSS